MTNVQMTKRTERPTLPCQTCCSTTPHTLADVEEVVILCGDPNAGYHCIKCTTLGGPPTKQCKATDIGLGIHYRCTKCATRRRWGFEGGEAEPPEHDWSGGTFGEILDKHKLECEDDLI